MIRCCALLFGLLFVQSNMLLAHEVQHTVETTDAVVIRLTYADSSPFAFEAFEIYPEGKEMPAQVGRTDAQGRAVFIPGDTRRWHIKSFTADGHGVDLHIDTPAMTATVAPASTGEDPNRASLMLFGLSLILALFGLYQLMPRKKS